MILNFNDLISLHRKVKEEKAYNIKRYKNVSSNYYKWLAFIPRVKQA